MRLKTEAEQKQHEQMMIATKNILDENNVTNILTGSALLGIYRDSSLRPNCMGIVFTCFYNEIKPVEEKIKNDLIKNGFKIKRHYRNKNFKIRAAIGRLQIEIVGYHLKGKFYYRELRNKVKYIPAKFLNKTCELEFNSIKYTVPSNIEGFLQYCYNDWRTPINNTNLIPSCFKTKNHMRIK